MVHRFLLNGILSSNKRCLETSEQHACPKSPRCRHHIKPRGSGTRRIRLGNPLVESWIYATMRVENEQGGTGTGFLVSRRVGETGHKVFLATNKHVIGRNTTERLAGKSVTLHLNVKDGQSTKAQSMVVPLDVGTDKTWREH